MKKYDPKKVSEELTSERKPIRVSLLPDEAFFVASVGCKAVSYYSTQRRSGFDVIPLQKALSALEHIRDALEANGYIACAEAIDTEALRMAAMISEAESAKARRRRPGRN